MTKHLTQKDHITLTNAMYSQHFTHEQLIIKYGDIGDKYFVLSKGTVKVKVYEPGTSPFDPELESKIKFEKILSAEKNMIGFGEIALLMNDKRTASVIAQGESGCDCWVLSADVFKHIIAQNTLSRRNINLNYLNQVDLFKSLEIHEKMKLIDGLSILQLKKGEFVFHQGDVGEEFFIIEQGECECIKVDDDDQFTQVRLLGQGDHFGEIAILKNVLRTLSVRAVSEDIKLLVLSRKAFIRILGSIKDALKEDYQKTCADSIIDTSLE